jgi:hypothetical protein
MWMKAIIAVASLMVTAAFHVLTTGSEYKDSGPPTSIAEITPMSSSV